MATKKPAKQNLDFKMGWLPDLPDARDLLYSASLSAMKTLKPKVDLRRKCPPVYNQGSLGSCTANALGAAFQFGQKRQKIPNWIPSRLFIYYNERVLINTVFFDSGAFIRDGIKTMNRQGVCPEKLWPYTIPKFIVKPSPECYKKALTNQILSYYRLNSWSLKQLQSCISDGFPFVFGFTVYESFLKIGKNGIMPMPKTGESVIGGHAVMAVGYDNSKAAFIVRNSWGKGWGDKGYFYMPYTYILANMYCSDFWTIRVVEKGLQVKRGR